ncbi:ABC transporter substrate-binding protein [Qipengyuania atrilutea]|uniref:ABC transporter substrate-binding protein n=1 Tax=Qipengyuania atrilutea TaxID=2744473 RepID=A0A850HAG8_9SPHN|nr:ABC transporter substrate-binding protein [Actirhodobacter atriluteus]NVD44069.1 ABC transporter substrate-binding protein [Actirhodobacter atriluteus]
MRTLSAVLALMALTGCSSASAPPPSVMLEKPSAIVSLNPCLDAMLLETADPAQIAALSHYSRDAASSSIPQSVARRFDVTGGTAEEVVALSPDLVVAGSFIAPATQAALERLGMRVETFGIARTVGRSVEQVRRVGEVTGNASAAERLAGRIERAVEDAAPPAGAKKPSAVLWQPGGIVPGEEALVSELLTIAGFENHAAARGLGQADYLSLEEVLADPPDLLLIAGEETGQEHPVLDKLPNTRRARFDPSLLYCGGPTIPAALERLKTIRGELLAERGA